MGSGEVSRVPLIIGVHDPGRGIANVTYKEGEPPQVSIGPGGKIKIPLEKIKKERITPPQGAKGWESRTPIYGIDGEPTGYFVVACDIEGNMLQIKAYIRPLSDNKISLR